MKPDEISLASKKALQGCGKGLDQCEHDNGTERARTAGIYDEARCGWIFPDKTNG